MSENDELRGSIPVYSAKDILQKLDRKVDSMDEKLDTTVSGLTVLLSQNLNERLSRVETWQNKLTGLAWLGPILGAAAIVWQFLSSFRVVDA